MTETALNKFVNSRYGLFAFAIVALIVSYANSFGSETVADAGGLLPYSIGSISLSPFASWLANSLCICLSGVLLYIINKSFAFIRNYTVVHVTVFLFFSLVNPATASSLCAASVSTTILSACTFILFSNFQRKERRDSMFLIMLILSSSSLFCYPLIFYMPVFIIGFMQIQIFSFKGLLASIVGIALPYWLGIAFGIIDSTALKLPEIALSASIYAEAFRLPETAMLAYTIVLGTVFGISVAFTIMSYRLQIRAYNGFLNLMAVFTLLFIAIDLRHASAYLVTLNMLMAVQAAHFFTIRKPKRLYLLFFFVMLAGIATASIPMIANFSKI